MCGGEGCPLNKKNKCYRFRVIPDEYGQSYFAEAPYNQETKSCEYFWRIPKGPQAHSLKRKEENEKDKTVL
jgi:hypothetical protein